MTVHEFAGGEMKPNGDAVLACRCGAWFDGPPEQACDSYRTHMAEPRFPSETGRQS